jgi:hypothetical protein
MERGWLMRELGYFVDSKGDFRLSKEEVLQSTNKAMLGRRICESIIGEDGNSMGGGHRCLDNLGFRHLTFAKTVKDVALL